MNRSTPVRCAALLATSAVIAASAAADSAPSLAAPGDCAQPSRDLDTGPAQALPAPASSGVAGPPLIHFAPIAVTSDAVALLPLDLTRTLQSTAAVAAEAPTLLGSIATMLGWGDATQVPDDGGDGATGPGLLNVDSPNASEPAALPIIPDLVPDVPVANGSLLK